MSRVGDEKRRENAVVEKAEKTWTEKSKKWLTNGGGGCIIFLVSSASVLRAKPNSGDLHSGSAVDSDSTCGSSILSSPTRPQPNRLRYFRGIAQLVARLVRDEEAVGSNPAAPTEKDRYTFVCRSFSISAAGFERNPGCGSQRLFRPLGGPHILLAAAPTTPPCFRRGRRSSSLQLVTAASHSCTCFFIYRNFQK